MAANKTILAIALVALFGFVAIPVALGWGVVGHAVVGRLAVALVDDASTEFDVHFLPDVKGNLSAIASWSFPLIQQSPEIFSS